MRMRRAGSVVVAALSVMIAVPALAAPDIYMTIEGAQQGKFKGEMVRIKGEASEQIRVFSLKQESPARAVSGQRQHGTVTIVKRVDASSPSLVKAATRNEPLRSVRFTFVSSGSGAASGKLAETIELQNATISGLHTTGATESVTFRYDSIQVTYVNGSKSATDDWTVPNQ